MGKGGAPLSSEEIQPDSKDELSDIMGGDVDIESMARREVCRLCLRAEGKLKSIFALDATLPDKIHSCCSLEIYENDGLPDGICSGCLVTLDETAAFRSRCRESDRLLRLHRVIKQENSDPILTSKKDEDYISREPNELIRKNYAQHTRRSHDNRAKKLHKKSVINETDRDAKWEYVHSSRNENDQSVQKGFILEDVPSIKEEWDSDNDHEDMPLTMLAMKCEVQMEDVDDDVEVDVLPKRKLKKSKRKKDEGKVKKMKKNNRTGKVKASLKDKNEPSGSSLCPICGKVFLRLSSLNAHLRNHGTERPHACDECGKTFRERGQLKEHAKTHRTSKDFPCATCGKLFKSVYDAKRHADIVHKKVRRVVCNLCGKQLATSFGYKMHMKTHTGEKAFSCAECGQKFTFKYSLTLHARTHSGEKPYSCKFCGGRFSALKTVKEHERIHTGETPYACPECGKGFSQLSNMKSHFRNNHRGVVFQRTPVVDPVVPA